MFRLSQGLWILYGGQASCGGRGRGSEERGKVTFHVTFSYFESLDFFLLWKYIISFKNRSCFKDLTKGGVRGRLRREVICVYIQLIHSVVQQNVTQYCKAIILQLKKKDLIKAEKRNLVLFLVSMGFWIYFISFLLLHLICNFIMWRFNLGPSPRKPQLQPKLTNLDKSVYVLVSFSFTTSLFPISKQDILLNTD